MPSSVDPVALEVRLAQLLDSNRLLQLALDEAHQDVGFRPSAVVLPLRELPPWQGAWVEGDVESYSGVFPPGGHTPSDLSEVLLPWDVAEPTGSPGAAAGVSSRAGTDSWRGTW